MDAQEIQAVERLVEQHQVGIEGEGAQQVEALLLPAAEQGDFLVEECRFDGAFKQFIEQLHDGCRGEGRLDRQSGEDRLHGAVQVEGLVGVLEHHADLFGPDLLLPDPAGSVFGKRQFADAHLQPAAGLQSHDNLGQSGLAHPTGSLKVDDLPAVDLQHAGIWPLLFPIAAEDHFFSKNLIPAFHRQQWLAAVAGRGFHRLLQLQPVEVSPGGKILQHQPVILARQFLESDLLAQIGVAAIDLADDRIIVGDENRAERPLAETLEKHLQEAVAKVIVEAAAGLIKYVQTFLRPPLLLHPQQLLEGHRQEEALLFPAAGTMGFGIHLQKLADLLLRRMVPKVAQDLLLPGGVGQATLTELRLEADQGIEMAGRLLEYEEARFPEFLSTRRAEVVGITVAVDVDIEPQRIEQAVDRFGKD